MEAGVMTRWVLPRRGVFITYEMRPSFSSSMRSSAKGGRAQERRRTRLVNAYAPCPLSLKGRGDKRAGSLPLLLAFLEAESRRGLFRD
jgi:hypothetical protein